MERFLDAMIKRLVECDFGEEHQWFRKGRGTVRPGIDDREDTGGTVHGSMALVFVYLEKAFDTISREMVMATLRWMRV